MKKIHKRKRGFTLIEILIVIGLIAILAAIVLVAINPARQFAQARNSQRESNVTAILNAIGQDIADNKGVFGGVCSGTTLPASTTNIGTDAGKINLSCLAPTYIATGIPTDPIGSAADTLYTIAASSSGRVTVCAPKHDEPGILNAGEYCLTR